MLRKILSPVVLVGCLFPSLAVAQNLIDVKLPPGAVIAFDLDECPRGWEPFDDAEGRFLRGMIHSDVPGQKGGSNVHSHQGSTNAGGHGTGVDNDNDKHPSNNNHTHKVTTDEQQNVPEYVAVLFCRLSGD